MPPFPRIVLLPLVATLIAAALAGCGGGEEQAPAPEAQPPAATTAAPAEPAPATGTLVAVGDSPFGRILVDRATGLTLYVFTDDPSAETVCPPGSDDDVLSPCFGNPPLLTEGEPQAGEGIDASLLGTTERSDGSLQVTYNGHPLYTYDGDIEPGDTNGHGRAGKWFIVSVEGTAVTITTEE